MFYDNLIKQLSNVIPTEFKTLLKRIDFIVTLLLLLFYVYCRIKFYFVKAIKAINLTFHEFQKKVSYDHDYAERKSDTISYDK